jgi:MFS transporter, UMF1 family
LITRNHKATIGWVFYDFANSAYAVVVLAVIFNIYFASVVAGGVEGLPFQIFGMEVRIPGVSLFSFINVIALLFVSVASPILGALADYSGRKKRWLAACCAMGVLATMMLVFVGVGDFYLASALFILSHVAFASGSVFYDAFLPEIAPKGREASVSGLGYGAGYLGGGLLLVGVLYLESTWEAFEFRHSFLLAGLWWLLFATPTFLWLHDKPVRMPAGRLGGYLKIGYRRVRRTLAHFRELPVLERFLISYLIFGTGIESVIRLASIFGAQELGMQQRELILFFLVIQGCALLGAMVFGNLADLWDRKKALQLTLALWVLVLLWSWFLGIFTDPKSEFWAVGVLAGLAMGGSQSIARGLQSVILPKGMESEFFGFFTMSGRGANILGMLTFGLVTWLTGDMRLGILSLLFFFLAGMLLLKRVHEPTGRKEAERFSARYSLSFEEDSA